MLFLLLLFSCKLHLLFQAYVYFNILVGFQHKRIVISQCRKGLNGVLRRLSGEDEVLEPIVRLYTVAVGPTFVLVDDNPRPHRAAIVHDYLENEGIARMSWPTYSPDLNPIENFWDALGRAVSSRFPPLAFLIELKTALQDKWRLLNSAMVDYLIESMVTRCKLCILHPILIGYVRIVLYFHFIHNSV